MGGIKKHFALIFSTALLASMTHAAGIPSNARSREAIARVKPGLTADLEKQGLHFGSPIFIRMFKESKELELWVKGKDSYQLFRTYKICYFSGGLGPKQRFGDNQSPEGFYDIKPNQLNPYSDFHLSFGLDYPNAYDRAHKRTGNALMIHGNCVSIGCYAMTDPKIEEIYALADAAFRQGLSSFQVHIFPFRMNGGNMERYSDSKWIDFWENLKEGYDSFERDRNPPSVSVRNKRYVFATESQ